MVPAFWHCGPRYRPATYDAGRPYGYYARYTDTHQAGPPFHPLDGALGILDGDGTAYSWRSYMGLCRARSQLGRPAFAIFAPWVATINQRVV